MDRKLTYMVNGHELCTMHGSPQPVGTELVISNDLLGGSVRYWVVRVVDILVSSDAHTSVAEQVMGGPFQVYPGGCEIHLEEVKTT